MDFINSEKNECWACPLGVELLGDSELTKGGFSDKNGLNQAM